MKRRPRDSAEPKKRGIQLNPWLQEHAVLLGAWASLIAIVGIPLLALGGIAAYLEVRHHFVKPAIALDLASPKNVRFRLVNQSSALLRDPQYSVNLWDLDARLGATETDAGNLLIPIRDLGYIRPRSALGPWSISSLSDAAGRVPPGHVVFGWVYVQCPECSIRPQYWFQATWGKDAWYSPAPVVEQLLVPQNLLRVLNAGAEYAKVIDEIVPSLRRIQVWDE